MGNAYRRYKDPELIPHPHEEPSFEPLDGFPNGRKLREKKYKDAEMQSSKVPIKDRDYCAHYLLDFRQCRRDHFPFVYRCHHQKHKYLHCEYEDYVLRMKEFEREKRLRALELACQ